MDRGKATFIRLLLAGVLAVASVTDSARAQIDSAPPTNNIPPSRGDGNSNNGGNNNKAVWYVVGGVAVAIVGWMIGTRVFNPDPPPRLDQPPIIPPLDPISLPPPGQNPPSTRVQGKQANQGNQSNPAGANLRNGFNLPPLGETRFVQNEVMLDIPSSVPTATLNAVAARHGMTRLETQSFRLTGRTLHRWRLDGGTAVPDMIRVLAR
jgi:hypothetical protein